MYFSSSVCVCVISSHLFWTSSSLDVPDGITQEEGHTGFLIHLPSAVHALIFLARRIQPFLPLVYREVEFCVLTIKSFSTCWAFLFSFFLFFGEKKSRLSGFELMSQRVRRLRDYFCATGATGEPIQSVCRSPDKYGARNPVLSACLLPPCVIAYCSSSTSR